MFSLPLKKDRTDLLFVFFLFIVLFLTGCSNHQSLSEGGRSTEVDVENVDPLEGFNRKVYVFNGYIDDYVAEPISDAYLWITPEFVQTGVSNFFSNLRDINVVLNDFMQGKLGQSGEDSGRFLINSTIGLGGLFDVATDLGFDKHDEDFAQTLAVWGVPQGPYLVIPVLGPITTRGIPGGVFDAAANPASYFGLPVQLLQALNARASAEGALNFIDEAALDPYIFTRESFLQYRTNLITDGESEINDDVFDIEDDFYEEETVELNNTSVIIEKKENQPNVLISKAKTEVKALDYDLDEQIKEARSRLKLRAGNHDHHLEAK